MKFPAQVAPARLAMPLLAVILCFTAILLHLGAQIPGTPAQTFTLRERYGVSHPEQIATFDYGKQIDLKQAYMAGPRGEEVPYQLLKNGTIAVRTDLPAKAQRSWTLHTGRAPKTFANLVTVKSESSYYEITNGVIGVRITRPEGSGDTRLAPIQGLQMKTGQWTATGPNYIGERGTSNNPAAIRAVTAKTEITEMGPLQVTVEVSYQYNRPNLEYGNAVLIPGGAGSYKSTIRIQAGQPSVLIEDDTNMDLQYFLNVYDAVTPDQARYRGHSASTVQNGRTASGGLYASGYDSDAFRELQYTMPGYSSYLSTLEGGAQLIKRSSAWDLWAYDSGWNWVIYNQGAGPQAAVVGIFAGQAGRAIGAGNSGAGVYTDPGVGSGGRRAGITFQSNRTTPAAEIFPHVRVSWGLFLGTKADMGDPSQVQLIGKQMNLHGGINLNKIARYAASFNNAAAPLYTTMAVMNTMIQKVRTEASYYNYLYEAEPYARGILEIWKDTSGTVARRNVTELTAFAQTMLDTLVNQNGIYDTKYHYWMGGMELSRRAQILNVLMLSDALTGSEKEGLKPVASLFANLLWDNDYVPMVDGNGLNMGTANMPTQHKQYQSLYALMFPQLPGMAGRAGGVAQGVVETLNAEVNASGAQRGTPHYAGAAMNPLTSTMQQLKNNGMGDLFRSEPKMAKFGQFYLDFLTPPEPRFGGVRKLVSIGDGSTESVSLHGQLATGFADVDAGLAGRLMSGWVQSGKTGEGTTVSTILKINEGVAQAPMNLKSGNYPGWHSVLRNGFDTPNETALWFVNGNFYSDHRHEDAGTVAMYALKAPLSIDWGSLYEPHAPAPYMHSIVMPEAAIGQSWDSANVALGGTSSPWQNATQQAFGVFDASAVSTASFQSGNGTVWTRTVRSVFANSDYPVIAISDQFTGPDAFSNKIFTLNMMAQGFVQSTVGNITPPLSAYPRPPSASPPLPLPAGLNQFRFLGQWLIDWDLYTTSPRPQQVLIGNWAHKWHPSLEQSQFALANKRPFEERQHIFRLRGVGPFNIMLLPYRKGQRQLGRTVTSDATGTMIKSPTEQTTLTDNSYAYQTSAQKLLTTYNSAQVSANGITISGGPSEVIVRGAAASITAHGPAGTRKIQIPGSWRGQAGVTINNGVITIDYRGGDRFRVVLAAN